MTNHGLPTSYFAVTHHIASLSHIFSNTALLHPANISRCTIKTPLFLTFSFNFFALWTLTLCLLTSLILWINCSSQCLLGSFTSCLGAPFECLSIFEFIHHFSGSKRSFLSSMDNNILLISCYAFLSPNTLNGIQPESEWTPQLCKGHSQHYVAMHFLKWLGY